MTASSATLNYTLRTMRASDVSQAHQLTQKLCWPHRQEDWLTMFHLSTALVIEHEGSVIGTACAVTQGNHTSLGLVVIADEYQGYGLGRKIVTAVMNASQSDSFFLSATAAGQPLYEKLGFHEYARIKQYQGHVCRPAEHHIAHNPSSIRAMQARDYDSVIRLLNQASGLQRDAVFNAILADTQATIVLEQDETIVGVACYRTFGRGDVIGPVVARNRTDANALLTHLLSDNQGKFVRVDTPANYQLAELLQSWGLVEADDVAAMYLNAHPQPDSTFKSYCIITQALG